MNGAPSPRLSVIVPAYNAARTIESCLRSIREDLPSGSELIVVDDASSDGTASLAEPLAHLLIRKARNAGDGAARRTGLDAASGDILLFIDSDIVIARGTCEKIKAAFQEHPSAAAVTGRLSAMRQPGFFTDYKNIYMNYIFERLPDRVTFTYGSIMAARADFARASSAWKVRVVGDTALGQELASQGYEVRLLRNLEVVHLKRYTTASFYRNDFMIPFQWARLFVRYNGWKQLGRNGTGFAHSSKTQLTSLGVSWVSVALAALALLGYCPLDIVAASYAVWLVLNSRFLFVLFRARGLWYGFRAIPVTFVDHLVMALGAGVGLINTYVKEK